MRFVLLISLLAVLALTALYAPIPVKLGANGAPGDWVEAEALGWLNAFADRTHAAYKNRGAALLNEITWDDLAGEIGLDASKPRCFGLQIESPLFVLFLFDHTRSEQVEGRYYGRDLCLRLNIKTGERQLSYELPRGSPVWFKGSLEYDRLFEWEFVPYVREHNQREEHVRRIALSVAGIAGLICAVVAFWTNLSRRTREASKSQAA